MNGKDISKVVSLQKTKKARDKGEKVTIDGLPVMYKSLSPDEVVEQVCASCKHSIDSSRYFGKVGVPETDATGEFMRCTKLAPSREQLIRNVFQLIKETFDVVVDKELLESCEVLFNEGYNTVTGVKVIICKIVEKKSGETDYEVEMPFDSPELTYASCEAARQTMKGDDQRCTGFEQK